MKNLLRCGLMALSLAGTISITAQVPLLSSYPSATSAVIFLDFDGHTVAGTSWNSGTPIFCAGSGLSNADITEVFNRVAEDYRPFNLNITTDSTKFLAANINRRMRVIITVSSSWYGSAGGVAFVDSFTGGDDTPCFVFSALLGYNLKKISEASSHEAGHTLGLYHQSRYDSNCNFVSEYHSGTGDGEIGWAPIMGVGYTKNLTLWNNGPNSFGCTSYQTDLEIITAGNGFNYRTDDHSGTFSGATTATFTSNQFNINGVVERNTDMDMIKFTLPLTGRFELSGVPYNVGTGNSGSDLDIQITLFNSAHTQLNVFNPGTLLNSAIDTILNPGTYFLRIEGRGNINAPNYASLGSYSLQGNFTDLGPLPLRKLELHGALAGNKHEFDWVIDADEQVVHQVLEISADGRNFTPVVESPVDARNFVYRPFVTGAAQYRLNVVFDNGRQNYSNVVTLRATGVDQRPQLIGNVITGTITVSSPGVFTYSIYDLSGKVQAKGQLSNGINNIVAQHMSSGIYLIRFSNNTEHWIEKLVKQ